MNEIIPSQQLDISEYVLPSRLFTSSKSFGNSVKVYYLTDLHLEYYIKPTDDIDKRINKIVSNLTDDDIFYLESVIYIGGDVANSFYLAEKFYRRLRKRYPDVRIIAVLGNHEISEFNTLEEANNKYALLFNELRIVFLNNEAKGLIIGAREFEQRFICVGGIGFAPFNDTYNADNLVASKDIQFNREREKAESTKFLQIYYKALEKAIEKKVPLLVLTHYPIQDWLPETKVDPHCYYFNGHNHANDYYIKDNAPIVADNQIGYKAKSIHFKEFSVGTIFNPFHYYADGYFEIEVKDYFKFYRYSGIMISGEGKAITNCINRGCRFYMIKKNGFYMFVLIGNNDAYLCVGAKTKKIPGASHIEYFYNAFDVIVQRYISLFASTYNGLKIISNELIKYGFDGRIHGFIIDIDFYNHIMFNPFEQVMVFYYSPTFGLAKRYPDIKSLLCSIKENTSRNDYFSLKEYKKEIKKLDKAIAELHITNPFLLEDGTKNDLDKLVYPSLEQVSIGQDSMYDYSKRMLQIQRLFDSNILREWNEALIEDLYIEEEYRPVVKAPTAYKLVKSDWRNYLQLEPHSRTKRVTMVCFPTLDTDYLKFDRIWFPNDSNHKQESMDVLKDFITAIPEKLLKDQDIMFELFSSLTIEDFLAVFPKSLLTTDVKKSVVEFYWEERDFAFPPKFMTYDLWKYIYDNNGYSKRKNRIPSFPKEIWDKIRTNH